VIAHLLVRPPDARWLYVLAHGAGAGMRHVLMEDIAQALAAEQVATLRYEFPYMASGKKRPDPPEVAVATVRAACAAAREVAPDLRLAAGGKSFGGRMTSTALAAAPEPRVEGCVFLGFPLHPAKQPATKRAEHLVNVPVPMLFVQGTRDALAEPALLRPIVATLPRATLHEIDGADHGFAVPRRQQDPRLVIPEIASTVRRWLDGLPSPLA
jgi:uncharacterized protein